MAKYVTLKTVQAVFPNADLNGQLTIAQFEATQNAVRASKYRNDTVDMIETDRDAINQIDSLELSDVRVYGDTYILRLSYNKGEWKKEVD